MLLPAPAISSDRHTGAMHTRSHERAPGRRWWRKPTSVLTAVTAASLTIATLTSAAHVHAAEFAAPSPSAERWSWPTSSHTVVHPFLAPINAYSSGHRGIDIAATAAETVYAPASGVVTFVGRVVDRDVLVMTHSGGVRSTLEPVASALVVGDRVARGQRVGSIAAEGSNASHCESQCLHLGVRVGDEYVSPLLFLDAEYSVLLPLTPAAIGQR